MARAAWPAAFQLRDQAYLLSGTARPLAGRFVQRQLAVLDELRSSAMWTSAADVTAASFDPAAGRAARYPPLDLVRQAFKQVEEEMVADLQAAG